MPFFSIITVCYNEENKIGKTMSSVYNQTFTDFEHIIVDGASTDRTIEKINSYADQYANQQLFFLSEPDHGIYEAMNKGLRIAAGQYICFINAGDTLANDFVLEEVRKIIKQKQADLYYGETQVVYPNGEIKRISRFQYETKEEILQAFEDEDSLSVEICHQAIFAGQNCFKDNMFDESFKLAADFKWFASSIINDMQVCKMNLPICKYGFMGGLSYTAENRKLAWYEINAVHEQVLGQAIVADQADFGIFWNFVQKFVLSSLLSDWMALNENHGTVIAYFIRHNFKKIAIYGIGLLGNHLIRELRDSPIEVAYILDRNIKENYLDIKALSIEELTPVDVIIVTPVTEIKAIRGELAKKTTMRVVSLEAVINEAWSYLSV